MGEGSQLVGVGIEIFIADVLVVLGLTGQKLAMLRLVWP